MKATLIIKNIHKLYASSPGSDVFSCIEHAFVAVHHARIIDLGTHDHQQWIDKDTRIIDASNEIVVPSFIDAHVRFCFDRRSGDNVRINQETMELFYKNGITTVGARQLPAVASSPYYQLFLCERQRLPIVDYGYLRHRQLKKGFLLSTSFLYEEQPFYDLMPLASLLCMERAAGAQEILAAMTLRPARALKLSGKRGIRKGADADMIVFQARDLEELFCSFGRQRLHRIIHQGVHIYPHVII